MFLYDGHGIVDAGIPQEERGQEMTAKGKALLGLFEDQGLNGPVVLFKGPGTIEQREKSSLGTAIVTFRWLPTRGVQVEFHAPNPVVRFVPGEAVIRLEERGIAIPTYLFSATTHNGRAQTLVGIARTPPEVGDGAELSYVRFHLTNFLEYIGDWITYPSADDESFNDQAGRLIIEADGWRTTLDSRDNLRELISTAREVKGYAITHFGKLERVDGAPFSCNDAKACLTALGLFLSFARGTRSTPILLVGFSENDERVWESWNQTQKIDSWELVVSPLGNANGHLLNPETLSSLLSGYFTRLNDRAWNNAIQRSIHWYLECLPPSRLKDGAIISLQAALELLSWVSIVEVNATVSAAGFEKLPASDRLRLMLSTAGIPAAVPDGLGALKTFIACQKGQRWNDGPQALTEVRNRIVHPKKRDDANSPPDAAIEDIWRLGLWYLDLLILKLMGHNGQYMNRLSWMVERVPWSTEMPSHVGR